MELISARSVNERKSVDLYCLETLYRSKIKPVTHYVFDEWVDGWMGGSARSVNEY